MITTVTTALIVTSIAALGYCIKDSLTYDNKG